MHLTLWGNYFLLDASQHYLILLHFGFLLFACFVFEVGSGLSLAWDLTRRLGWPSIGLQGLVYLTVGTALGLALCIIVLGFLI